MEMMAGCSSKLPLRSEVVTHDRNTRNNKIRSSVDEVLSNDDLLMEILLLLPILSLHLFRCVSKRWLSLITSPSFTLRRTQIPNVDTSSGLFIGSFGRPVKYDIVSFDPRISAKNSILFSFNSKKGTKTIIEQSCNGLLLCHEPGDKYYVCNPSISMFKMLPPIHDLSYYILRLQDMRMAFDPTQSPHYKVVHVGGVKDDDKDEEFGCSIRIQTYSSKTGMWCVWDDRFPSERFEGFCEGIYWNGAIHWFIDSYDNEPFHCKLEIVDRPVLTNIQNPLTVEAEVHSDRNMFGSYGSLLLLCKDYYSPKLNIYEMKNGYSEWSVKYLVNLDDMMRPFPTWRMPTNRSCSDILSIALGEQEKDSLMVIELSGKIIQYKFVLETVSELFDFGKAIRRSDCFEFIASFAHV